MEGGLGRIVEPIANDDNCARRRAFSVRKRASSASTSAAGGVVIIAGVLVEREDLSLGMLAVILYSVIVSEVIMLFRLCHYCKITTKRQSVLDEGLSKEKTKRN